jgi:integrase
VATRRGNQEGSITLRKDGLWVARVSHEGKRYAVYGKTKEQARQKLRDLQRKQDQGLTIASSRMLLKDYLAGWLENVRNRVRPKTHLDYSVAIRRHIMPQLGQIRIDKLTPDHVDRAWATLLREGASASVVQYAHLRLSKALNDAMRRNLIFRNPCQAVSPPKPGKKTLRPPDTAAIRKLLETARATDYYEAIHTTFYTGLRRNEALALRWRHVDLNEGSLSVGWSIYRAKGGQTIYQAPKTEKSKRSVALTPSSILVFRALRERQEADGRLQVYSVNGDTHVFRYRNGAPIVPRGLSGAFGKIMRRAGLEGYRFHDTRHAHASLMLRQGVHPKIVQERLGHSKVTTTLDIYSHVTPGLQQAAALRFDEGLTAVKMPEPSAEPIAG